MKLAGMSGIKGAGFISESHTSGKPLSRLRRQLSFKESFLGSIANQAITSLVKGTKAVATKWRCDSLQISCACKKNAACKLAARKPFLKTKFIVFFQ